MASPPEHSTIRTADAVESEIAYHQTAARGLSILLNSLTHISMISLAAVLW